MTKHNHGTKALKKKLKKNLDLIPTTIKRYNLNLYFNNS